MNKSHRLLVPFLSGLLLLGSAGGALANDTAAGCGDQTDATGDVACEQLGDQATAGDKGELGETGQRGDQGDKESGQTGGQSTGETGQTGEQGDNK